MDQLGALADLYQAFTPNAIDYWLFGGWAVDFHAGRVSRSHADIDIAVWQRDLDRIAAKLEADGWRHLHDETEDGYTSYERNGVRLEVAYLVRDSDGQVYTPLSDGRGSWSAAAFGDDVRELDGVTARVISLPALLADKAESRDDPAVTAKDRADLETLARLS